MDLQVPLNRLKFGHEDGEGINARVVGRQDGIAELAANIYARGQIENLVVKDCGGGFYAVANGNRRLAAFHTIYGETSDQPINCTLRAVDETGAFEDSLTTAITAKQLHPVDQYEAFARLEERGKTHEEIARQYGMSEKEVRQALALGRLSPKIRQAWRAGEIKSEIAKGFTLALDHKTQDKVFEKLKKQGRIWESAVRDALGASSSEIGELLDFVGADAFRDSGGKVVEDLFGSAHVVSDPALLKEIASTKLSATCEHLRSEGWSWAEVISDLPNGARWWTKVAPKDLLFETGEEDRLAALKAEIAKIHDAEDDDTDFDEARDRARLRLDEMQSIEMAVHRRSFTDRQKAKSGCIVALEDGRLVILFGVTRPSEPKASGADGSAGKVPAKSAASEPEEPAISNALVHRLSVQLTKAAATALMQDPDLGLCVLLGGLICYGGSGVRLSNHGMGAGELDFGEKELPTALAMIRKLTPQQRMEMVAQFAAAALDFQNMPLDQDKDDKFHGPRAICNALDAKALNAALRGAFDAKDYFAGVSKALCVKAIEEACGPDLARQQAKNPKGDIVKFAITNVPTTGWLPPQLRAKGYDGPPVKSSAKVTALPAAKAKKPAKATTPVKRAAAAKKAGKKTSKKKR